MLLLWVGVWQWELRGAPQVGPSTVGLGGGEQPARGGLWAVRGTLLFQPHKHIWLVEPVCKVLLPGWQGNRRLSPLILIAYV